MAQGERTPTDNVQDVAESKWKGVGCDRTVPEREPRNDYSQQLLTAGEREIARILTGSSGSDIQSNDRGLYDGSPCQKCGSYGYCYFQHECGRYPK